MGHIQQQLQLATLQGHSGMVKAVAISPDGKRIISGSNCKGKTVKIWDVASGCCDATLQGHNSDLCFVVVSPDSKKILSGGADNIAVKVWRFAGGRCDATLALQCAMIFLS